MAPQRPTKIWIFCLWLAAFYAVWLTMIITQDLWQVLADHYGIAVAMAFGSYFAGSTPMGGGTVGFPVLVLLFGESATLGRDFSFAVQSIGMTSASIFILCRRQPLEWVILRWSLIGSLIGTPIGVFFIAPFIPELAIKVFFAIIWASFGILHLYRTQDICANVGETPAAHKFDRNVGFLVGLFAGACVSSVTGVGIDMLLYAVMVLLMRADLKVAIPSSVVLMAFTSIVGIVVKIATGTVHPAVFGNWIAAAPIVALGAPFGVFIVSLVGRRPTLFIVAVLCILQFLWTIQQSYGELGALGVLLSVLIVGLFVGGFEWMWKVGDRLARRSLPVPLTP
jgi:uncharacterized membrane protein YfcA